MKSKSDRIKVMPTAGVPLINKNICTHECMSVEVQYRRNYLVRIENWKVTSASLDSEEEFCARATCNRCGHEMFLPYAVGKTKTLTFTKAVADFERHVKEIVDADAFVNELCDNEYWQG